MESQAKDGPFSKKSQFEDILNSKQNELVFEVTFIFKYKAVIFIFRKWENAAIGR